MTPRLLALALALSLAACAAPGQFRSTYQYLTPKTPEARACAARCDMPDGPAKTACWNRCGGKAIEQKTCVHGCSEAQIAPVETPNLREE